MNLRSSLLFSTLVLASFTTRAATAPAANGTPSTTERNQVNEDMKKLLEQADPTITAIFAKYPAFRLVPLNTAVVPNLNAGFAAKHATNVELAKKGDIDVLFMGDSITDFWRNAGNGPNAPMAGKAVFDKYFGDMKVANFGISGDSTQGVLYRLQNGEGQGFQPKAIMLMIGTNNTGTNSASEIAEGITADVQEMRKDFPAAKILLLAVFPRSTPGTPIRQTLADINAIIAKLDDHKNVFYMDIGPKFLDANGTFLEGTFLPSDGYLHPTTAGYEIWAQAVKDPLANMVKGLAP